MSAEKQPHVFGYRYECQHCGHVSQYTVTLTDPQAEVEFTCTDAKCQRKGSVQFTLLPPKVGA